MMIAIFVSKKITELYFAYNDLSLVDPKQIAKAVMMLVILSVQGVQANSLDQELKCLNLHNMKE